MHDGWISVEERLPEEDENVLVYGPWGIGNGYSLAFWYDSAWNDVDSGYPLDNVSHWMPLPDPPKEVL